jgi:hypothetical protein
LHAFLAPPREQLSIMSHALRHLCLPIWLAGWRRCKHSRRCSI